jgi:hypothetical protein
MRPPVALTLLLALASPAAHADEGPYDDDPKRFHDADALYRDPPPSQPTPRAKFSYRRFTVPNLDGTPLPFNTVQLDIYAVSRRWFRAGVEASIGSASGTLGGKASTAWYVLTGFSLGVQYPWRITPFLDWHFAAGLMGGDVAGSSAVSYAWLTGLEGGAEIYVVGRMFLSVAFGWLHPVYHGIDWQWSMAHPMSDPPYLDVVTDTWTVKAGVGF